MCKDIEGMLLICGYQIIFLFWHYYPPVGEYKGKNHKVKRLPYGKQLICCRGHKETSQATVRPC